MRLALLHLDLSGGPEDVNLAVLLRAIRLAAEHGANWVVTPETAVQGYFFAGKGGLSRVPVQLDYYMQAVEQLVVRYGLTLFLGCAERDAETSNYYNCCLVIGPDGRLRGCHRKMRTHNTGAEAWATRGDRLEPVSCPGMKAGVLICADSWFVDNAQGPKG